MTGPQLQIIIQDSLDRAHALLTQYKPFFASPRNARLRRLMLSALVETRALARRLDLPSSKFSIPATGAEGKSKRPNLTKRERVMIAAETLAATQPNVRQLIDAAVAETNADFKALDNVHSDAQPSASMKDCPKGSAKSAREELAAKRAAEHSERKPPFEVKE